MKIAQIVPSLEFRHGGPSVSVPNLAHGLVMLGHETSLFATGPAPAWPTSIGSLHVQTFRRDWPAALCPSAGLRQKLLQSDAEIYHSHGLWLRTLHYGRQAAQRRGVPHVISPRGMMSGWAWRHRAWRKKFVRTFIHPGAFDSAAGWHATSAEEAEDIRALGFKQPICVAPNGTSEPTAQEVADAAAYWRETCPDVTRRSTAVFYSRFHRKKRVLELIDLWLERAPADWQLLMVGLPDDYTPAQLETYVMRSSGGGRIHIFSGEDRPAPYAVGSVFLLPSQSENFGLAIAEAMAHGVPALVTDTTPWTALNANGTGWCVPWERYPATLLAALAEGPAALAARGAQARAYALAEFSWQRSAGLLVEFYRQLRGAQSVR